MSALVIFSIIFSKQGILIAGKRLHNQQNILGIFFLLNREITNLNRQ